MTTRKKTTQQLAELENSLRAHISQAEEFAKFSSTIENPPDIVNDPDHLLNKDSKIELLQVQNQIITYVKHSTNIHSLLESFKQEHQKLFNLQQSLLSSEQNQSKREEQQTAFDTLNTELDIANIMKNSTNLLLDFNELIQRWQAYAEFLKASVKQETSIIRSSKGSRSIKSKISARENPTQKVEQVETKQVPQLPAQTETAPFQNIYDKCQPRFPYQTQQIKYFARPPTTMQNNATHQTSQIAQPVIQSFGPQMPNSNKVLTPQYSPRYFDGSYAEYQGFIWWFEHWFEKVYAQINDIDRGSQLKNLMKAKAKELLSNVPDDQYWSMKDLLARHYGRPEFAQREILTQLENIEPVSETRSLNDFIIESTNIHNKIKQHMPDYGGRAVIESLKKKLPIRIQEELRRVLLTPFTIDLEEFLEALIRVDNILDFPTIKPQEIIEIKVPPLEISVPPPEITSHQSQTLQPSQKRTLKCLFCDEDHFSSRCTKISSREQKEKWLINHGRCTRCAKTGHQTRHCSERCNKCQGAHTRLICPVEHQLVSLVTNLEPDPFIEEMERQFSCVDNEDKLLKRVKIPSTQENPDISYKQPINLATIIDPKTSSTNSQPGSVILGQKREPNGEMATYSYFPTDPYELALAMNELSKFDAPQGSPSKGEK